MNNQTVEKQMEIVKPESRPQTYSLAPRSMTEAMEFAKLMANSDLVPRDYKGKPGNILAAVQFGVEIGLAPMQAMQNISVINSRPCVWGDAMLGLVQTSGLLEDFKEWTEGNTAYCRVKRKGYAESHTSSFSDDDAKRAGLFGKQGPWTQYPERMRQMRARAFALRDQFADAIKGLNSAEEVSDYNQPKQVQAQVLEPVKNDPVVESKIDNLPTEIDRFFTLNEKLTGLLGPDAYKAGLKNGKGESPTLDQIKTWRSPKQIAWIRTVCDKIEHTILEHERIKEAEYSQVQVEEVVNG